MASRLFNVFSYGLAFNFKPSKDLGKRFLRCDDVFILLQRDYVENLFTTTMV